MLDKVVDGREGRPPYVSRGEGVDGAPMYCSTGGVIRGGAKVPAGVDSAPKYLLGAKSFGAVFPIPYSPRHGMRRSIGNYVLEFLLPLPICEPLIHHSFPSHGHGRNLGWGRGSMTSAWCLTFLRRLADSSTWKFSFVEFTRGHEPGRKMHFCSEVNSRVVLVCHGWTPAVISTSSHLVWIPVPQARLDPSLIHFSLEDIVNRHIGEHALPFALGRT